MTNPSPDWLDDVLRSRPVDDEGFSARVSGLGRSEARTAWIVRVVIAVVVVGGIAACTAADLEFLGKLYLYDGSVDGSVWIDEHRAAFARVVDTFDKNPALRRRAGRDASAVLNEAFRQTQFPNVKPENFFACAKVAGDLQAHRDDVAARGVCDTSWITGLADYDEWKTPPVDGGISSDELLMAARAHLRQAAEQPLVPGAPAPFAVAARDVEALGRLTMNHTWLGARFLGLVASEHERAVVAARAGDHVLVVDADDARLLERAWFAGIAFTSPSATDDDLAAVGRMQSVLACGALSDAFATLSLAEKFLDDHQVERLQALDRTGCSPPRPHTLEDMVCDGTLSAGFCRLAFAPSLLLPPFRQQVVRALGRWNLPKLSLEKTPARKKPETATTTTATTTTATTTTATTTTATTTEQR